jgi:RNA polymerase sigma factor (sigma-70 family)
MKYANESELVAACGREDAAAQRVLFERYAPKTMSVCLRYAPTRAEAEDLLQDTFVKVFDHIRSFQQAGRLEGWIRRIAINTALTYLRRQQIHFETIEIEQAQELSVAPEILEQLEAEQLMNLITQMPLGYRLVFNLFALEGLSHAEIAEQLHIEAATSRSQLVKARRWLQNAIETQLEMVQK